MTTLMDGWMNIAEEAAQPGRRTPRQPFDPVDGDDVDLIGAVGFDIAGKAAHFGAAGRTPGSEKSDQYRTPG
jgi:hypothetical protein